MQSLGDGVAAGVDASEIVVEVLADIVDDGGVQGALVAFEGQHVVGLGIDDLAISFCVPMASMVMMAPLMSMRRSNSGMAVISLDLSSQAT